jgi:hypothetical protein
MGRKKITIDKIEDFKNRRLSFKKRRMSLLKKALQLAKLSGCSIYLKVYNHQDLSLLELDTGRCLTENQQVHIKEMAYDQEEVAEYVNVNLDNYNLIEEIEDQVTKHGHLNLKEKYA